MFSKRPKQEKKSILQAIVKSAKDEIVSMRGGAAWAANRQLKKWGMTTGPDGQGGVDKDGTFRPGGTSVH